MRPSKKTPSISLLSAVVFKPTLLSVASVIAFLLNPKASHGQSMLFLDAFSEDLSRHLEATGLARSVKVPPLTDNTSIYLTETTKPQDVAPRAFNNGLVIVRCTPANTTDASGAVDSSPSLDIKLQRGKAVLIADFGDSDCPWRTNGEGADIVRYSIVDFADMLVQTVEKLTFLTCAGSSKPLRSTCSPTVLTRRPAANASSTNFAISGKRNGGCQHRRSLRRLG